VTPGPDAVRVPLGPKKLGGEILSRLLDPARFLAGLVLRHSLYLLEGLERSAGKPLKILFAGPEDLRNSVLKRAFGPGASERYLGRVPLRLSCEAIAPRAPGVDMVVRHTRHALERLPRGCVLARLPAWVRTEVDLRSPECLARGKQRIARIGRATGRAGFTAERARSEAEFVDFYDAMHLPLVRSRHGQGASVQKRGEVLAGLRTGRVELLLVKKDGQVVAGGTVEFTGQRARFWQIGVRGGDPALLEAGAADAVYYHVLSLCRERGTAVLNLGHSRPFVRDGVFEYKRMLGAYIASDWYSGIDLAVPHLTPGAVDFLADNPLITLEADGRIGLRGYVRGGADEARALAAHWRRMYCFMGTIGLRVFVLEDGGMRELEEDG
jgi:hypothetical protein